jgi:hypothetical protein
MGPPSKTFIVQCKCEYWIRTVKGTVAVALLLILRLFLASFKKKVDQ